MNARTDIQFIRGPDGKPAFVVMPYAQFKKLGHAKQRQGVPQDVVNRVFEQSLSPMAAWREHLSLTQAALAADMGITQAAYAQMERSKRPRRVTLERVAQAMGLQVEQLNW